MERYTNATDVASNSSPSEAWLFAQAILGNPIPDPRAAAERARHDRELVEFAASISDRARAELDCLRAEEAQATCDRELLEWLAPMSEKHDRELRALQQMESWQREGWQRLRQICPSDSLLTEWNAADHPRAPTGTPIGGQWVPKGGGGSGAGKSSSFLDRIIQRNRTVSELSGVVTPSMIRSTRIAAELQSAARLPGEVARAAAAGLGTGGKAVVNGFATSVKDVATLGLSLGQLELIGVNKEDRDRGYDTAVSISTASGQVLIAVGTGGMALALSKGGAIARTASGALVAFDAAGNAVGVVQGVYDASQNGVTFANGAEVAGGLLGLGANTKAARDLGRAANARRVAEIDAFVKKLPRKATPTRKPADLYEIKHAGPYNYELSGGGVKFEIDGYRGSTILEAKHADKPNSSPYVPGSTCPEAVRASILADTRDRLKKAATIIKSGSTPFKSVEIITNTPGSKSLFENMLREIGLPGTVRVAP